MSTPQNHPPPLLGKNNGDIYFQMGAGSLTNSYQEQEMIALVCMGTKDEPILKGLNGNTAKRRVKKIVETMVYSSVF